MVCRSYRRCVGAIGSKDCTDGSEDYTDGSESQQCLGYPPRRYHYAADYPACCGRAKWISRHTSRAPASHECELRYLHGSVWSGPAGWDTYYSRREKKAIGALLGRSTLGVFMLEASELASKFTLNSWFHFCIYLFSSLCSPDDIQAHIMHSLNLKLEISICHAVDLKSMPLKTF